jgi:hypothetical protein
LKLEILGPAEAELAQEIEYVIKYKNNGNTRLEEPILIFECPKNSLECLLRDKEESAEEKKSLRKEILLDTIYPGEEKTFYIKARLLGKEDEIKTAQVWLSYRPKNLTARYESQTSLVTQIKAVPLTLEFDLSSKIDSGKEISFRLNYFSNADYPLADLGIKTEYPSDFEFEKASPKPLEKTEWSIGLLNKAEGGRIEITGNLKGEVGEQKQFKAQLGTWQDGEFVVLKETIRGVEIVTPSLYITQQINNNPQYVANAGDTLHYEIFFKNIGNDVLNNLFLVANLEGQLFDLQTLKAPAGDFEKGDNSIVFDWRKVSKLQFLQVGEEGKVEFWIDLKDDWQIANTNEKNQVLRNKIQLSQAQKEFTTKVNSKLAVLPSVYYEDEVFGNSGPTPSQVGETTTYTIIWQIKNYYNDVKNVRIKATLNNQVRLTGRIFPEDSRFTFDSGSREVVWEVGDLSVGKGILDPAPNVAFQIAFTPASFQKGTVIQLVGEATITGEDQFTELSISGKGSAVTDPNGPVQ